MHAHLSNSKGGKDSKKLINPSTGRSTLIFTETGV